MLRGPKTILAIAGVVTILSLTACTAPAEPDTTANLTPAEEVTPGARAQFLALVGVDPNVDAAVDKVIHECMSTAGFDFHPPRTWEFDLDKNNGAVPPLSVEEAKRSGYATTTKEFSDRENPPAEPENESEEFAEALSGSRDQPDVTVELFGSETSWTAGGCVEEAAVRVYGSTKNELIGEDVVYNAGLEALTASREDPGIPKVMADWASCMSDTPFPQFRAPYEAYKSTLGSATSTIELAVADAECREEMDYSARLDRITDLYLSAFLTKYSAELVEVQQIRKDSQIEARKVLGG